MYKTEIVCNIMCPNGLTKTNKEHLSNGGMDKIMHHVDDRALSILNRYEFREQTVEDFNFIIYTDSISYDYVKEKFSHSEYPWNVIIQQQS